MTNQADHDEIPVTVGSDNVFADLGFPNAEEEQLKARLAYQIMRAIKRLGLSQTGAAQILGVSQPNVSNLARGHYEDFSIDRLLRFLKALGADVEIKLRPTELDAVGSEKHEAESPVRGAEFSVEENAAVQFHERVCTDSVSVWREGLNILLRGFDPIHGRVIEEEEETVLIALLMRAWQTVYRSYDTALKGYYPQALNLLRTPIEDWLAYWYVRSFPAEYERFTDGSSKTPLFNDMLTKLEGRHFEGKPDPRIRSWIKRLYKYSHVDAAGVQLVVVPSDANLKLLLGPDQDDKAFHYCSAEAVALVLMLMEALDNMRRLFGLPGIPEFSSFQDRVERHHRALAS